MSVVLRPYQVDIVDQTRAALAKTRSTLIVLQTGGGKTQIASYIARGAFDRGRSVMFACHRDFLIEQTSDTFASHGIPHSFIAAGNGYDSTEPVTIASIDTLRRRIGRYPAPDVFIVDEAIHAAAEGWSNVINGYQAQGSLTLGLAACPHRGDGIGLGKWFKSMVVGPSMAELIDMGYLSPFKLYAPSSIERDRISVRAGEFVNGAAEEAVNKPHITGCAIEEYMRHALGKQGVIFCVSIKHSLDVCAAFIAKGIRAAHIGSDTDKDDRAGLLRDFKLGRIQVLTSVNIFSEGFDLPVVEYAGLLRPTKSLNTYRQQIGRVLRVADGKTHAHISDHVGNYTDHGKPDAHIEWTLSDREKRQGGAKDRAIPYRICPQCHLAHNPAPVCPDCAYVYPIQSREIEQVEGELMEVGEAEVKRKALRREVGRAKTADDLLRIAKERGYKRGWVYKQALLKGIRYELS